MRRDPLTPQITTALHALTRSGRTPTMDRAQCRPRTLPAYCPHAFAAHPRIAPATLNETNPHPCYSGSGWTM